MAGPAAKPVAPIALYRYIRFRNDRGGSFGPGAITLAGRKE